MIYVKYISIYTYNIKICIIYIPRNLTNFNAIVNGILKGFFGGIYNILVFLLVCFMS